MRWLHVIMFDILLIESLIFPGRVHKYSNEKIRLITLPQLAANMIDNTYGLMNWSGIKNRYTMRITDIHCDKFRWIHAKECVLYQYKSLQFLISILFFSISTQNTCGLNNVIYTYRTIKLTKKNTLTSLVEFSLWRTTLLMVKLVEVGDIMSSLDLQCNLSYNDSMHLCNL